MYYGRRRFVSVGSAIKKRTVMVDKYDYISGCWWMNSPYAKFKGKAIYQTYAAGVGEYARHLCCDNHCINPMHLLRGTPKDNAQDEVYMWNQYKEDIEYRIANNQPIVDRPSFMKLHMKKLVTEYLREIPLEGIIEEQFTYANMLMEELRCHNEINIWEM